MSTSETYTIPAVALSDAGMWVCTASSWDVSGRSLPVMSIPVIVPDTGEYSADPPKNCHLTVKKLQKT